jgi:hypothetical protein
MAFDKMAFDRIVFDKLILDKMTVGKMIVGKMTVGKMTIVEMTSCAFGESSSFLIESLASFNLTLVILRFVLFICYYPV